MNVTKVKQAIIDEDMTKEQLRGINVVAIRRRFPDEQMSGVFIKKVLRYIKMHTDKLQDGLNLEKVEKIISKDFPGAELDAYRKDGKRFILIGLDGLTEEDE
jgi:hypothetical protein